MTLGQQPTKDCPTCGKAIPIFGVCSDCRAIIAASASAPVAWRWRFGNESLDHRWRFSEVPLQQYQDREIQPLYTAPPQSTADTVRFIDNGYHGTADTVPPMNMAQSMGLSGYAQSRLRESTLGTADTVRVPSDGVALIAQERERQIQKEGWDAKHDLEHKPGELATAGYHYAANAAACLGVQPGSLHIWDNWPWHQSWWKPTTPQRDLVKAGALIAAEIDRLIAAAPKDTTP